MVTVKTGVVMTDYDGWETPLHWIPATNYRQAW